MLSKEQIEEIRESLNRSQNPVFFFDNDCDGLMSFLLLRRYIDRGKGVAIKSFPELDESYMRKVEELNSDAIFILDKPKVSKEFIEEAKRKNMPVTWIDHHEVDVNLELIKENNISYFNPTLTSGKNFPTSYIAYKIAGNKEDMWMAMVGCIADNYIPDFFEDFNKKYSEISKNEISSAFDLLYGSEIGKIVMIFSFALKDRTSSVVGMINLLFKVKSPYEILKEDDKNFKVLKRYEQVNTIYQKLLDKAKRVSRISRKVVFFQYGGELSLSADLSNELSYRFPGKVIIVAYVKGSIANVSIRGHVDVREITLNAIGQIEGSTGGGHKFATGAKVKVEDLPRLKEIFENSV